MRFVGSSYCGGCTLEAPDFTEVTTLRSCKSCNKQEIIRARATELWRVRGVHNDASRIDSLHTCSVRAEWVLYGPPLRHEARPPRQWVVAGAEGASRDCNSAGATCEVGAARRGSDRRIKNASIRTGDRGEKGDAVAKTGE